MWLAFFLALLFAAPLPAQKLSPRVLPGSQVRVTTSDPSWEQSLARFVELQADTLILVRPSLDSVRLPLRNVSYMEVLMPGYGDHTGVLGGVVGAVAMYKFTKDPGPELIPGMVRTKNVVVGAVAGAVIGYLLGPAERWREVRYR